MEAQGRGVTVVFDGSAVHLRFKKSDLVLPVAHIHAVEFKEPPALDYGFVHFRVGGDAERPGRGPNVAQFGRAALPEFRALVDAVRAAIGGPAASPAPGRSAQDDILDAIKRLGELRDAGVVTPAEFEAKKAELLARL